MITSSRANDRFFASHGRAPMCVETNGMEVPRPDFFAVPYRTFNPWRHASAKLGRGLGHLAGDGFAGAYSRDGRTISDRPQRRKRAGSVLIGHYQRAAALAA
jgi:hypothetical protein